MDEQDVSSCVVMKYDKARHILQTYHDVVIGNDGTDIDIALTMAIELIKMHEPKKPRIEMDFWNDDIDYWTCPICGEDYCAYDLECEPYQPHFCQSCGQAIDWSEYGEEVK